MYVDQWSESSFPYLRVSLLNTNYKSRAFADLSMKCTLCLYFWHTINKYVTPVPKCTRESEVWPYVRTLHPSTTDSKDVNGQVHDPAVSIGLAPETVWT
jgi:hypothetical protein